LIALKKCRIVASQLPILTSYDVIMNGFVALIE